MAYPSVGSNQNQQIYNNPHWEVSGNNVVQGDKSSIGEQIRLDIFIRQSLEELEKERFFTQMSGVYNLQKHSGKTIKKNKYIPLLDDANVGGNGLDSDGAVVANGNLYGSSKDIGVITGKLPTLTEIGGRVNRVSFTRIVLEGTVHRLGMFFDFTKESLDFDSDASLLQHMGKECLRGAYEIQEDMIAIDLIKGAGVQMFSGVATDIATMTGEGGTTASVVTYKDLQRLAMTLKENNAPNRIKASTGARIVDSKIIGAGFPLYVGFPLENQLRNMLDGQSNPCFIPVEKYAGKGATPLHGEIGTIGSFRIVVVPEMPEYTAGGAEDVGGDNVTYRTTKGFTGNTQGHTNTAKDYYDVFPMLAVASEAFTCLGFQADMGGKGNFKMITKMPGTDTADRTDPYGESGFTSIKWTHGLMIEWPEHIAIQYTLAEL